MMKNLQVPCLWMVIAGIRNIELEDYSDQYFNDIFPDFFIPKMRLPLRNSKNIIKYVSQGGGAKIYDHDGDSGMNKLDVDIPQHLIEGAEPTDFGFGVNKISEAMRQMVTIEERSGRRGITVLFNHWSRAPVSHRELIPQVLSGHEKTGRQFPPLCYFSEDESNLREGVIFYH